MTTTLSPSSLEPRTKRSVPEWRGKTPDSEIPKAVKLRIWERCGGRCQLTGRKLMVGDEYDFDHIIALADGGGHRETNLQLVWRPAHRIKSAEEAGPRAKVERQRAKHLGLWPAPKQRLKGRGFPKGRNRAAAEASDA